MDQHVGTVGLEFRGGRADSAPNLDSVVEAYTSKWIEKSVRFNPLVEMRQVASVGKGLKITKASKTKWKKVENDEKCHSSGVAVQGEIAGDLKRGCRE